MNRLSVIIPSRDINNLRPCVAAVRKHEPEARIIVVDDGIKWTLGTDVLFSDQQFTVIGGYQKFIFARACNQGIRAAGDSDVILCNDDALLESPGGFSLMQRAAEEHPEFGIIGAVTNLTGQPAQQRQSPICPKCYEEKLDYRHGDEANWTCRTCGYAWLGPVLKGLREVDHIAFVCCLLPRRALEALRVRTFIQPDLLTGGLLDERYTAYGSDDLDLCMQMRECHFKIGVHDGCYVDHGSLHSTFRGDPQAPGNIWPNHRLLRAKWGMPTNPADPEYRA